MGDSLVAQRDEDFDFSYEGLISLTSILGDVKPRGTPSDVIASLPRGTYSEWARPGATEERCPICLDDYEATDACLRIGGCSHWYVACFLPTPIGCLLPVAAMAQGLSHVPCVPREG
ncbi:hypothetical protein FKP32DRAFT_1610242 [Trametes sanguinea]|nr:hypothetical protein FKP32DRAFT_1610242 [Trametes sanguinea]